MKFFLTLALFGFSQAGVCQQAANDPTGRELPSGSYVICAEDPNPEIAIASLNSKLQNAPFSVMVMNPASYGQASVTEAKLYAPFKSISAPSMGTFFSKTIACVTVTK